MKIKTKKETGNRSMISCIGTGVLLSLLVSVILAMITATLFLNEALGENKINLVSIAITLISSIIGGTLTGKWMGGKYALVTLLTGGVHYLVLMGLGILFFDGLNTGIWTTLSAITSGSICACAICITGKGRGRHRKRISR